ncbi:Protein priA [Rhodotorula toruloides]|nr:Protein priA [Rhodotorula toruloides]
MIAHERMPTPETEARALKTSRRRASDPDILHLSLSLVRPRLPTLLHSFPLDLPKPPVLVPSSRPDSSGVHCDIPARTRSYALMSRRRRSSIPLLGQLVALFVTASSTVAQLDILDSSSPSTAHEIAFSFKNLRRRQSEDTIELLRRNSAAQELLHHERLRRPRSFHRYQLRSLQLRSHRACLPFFRPVLCSGGTCVSGCRLGYAWSARASACINVASDSANCGSVGNVCLVPTGAAGAACQAGACVASECSSGYRLTNGTCAAVPFASDPSNCGRPGNRCPASFANGVGSICENGACMPERCVDGYAWSSNATACILATSTFATPRPTSATSANPQTTSTPAHAAVPHSDTQSTISTTSTTDSSPTTNTAAAASASARSRQRRASLVARIPSLCPPGLTACPIPSAASFGAFQASNFTSFRSAAASSPSLDGGFECIDIQYEYESCGGCTSMGEGRNCGEGIAHARGTGCQEGRCVVFSCEKGWRPDRDAKRCVRLWEGGRKKSSGHGKGRRRLH